jgi:hypothetical protein
MAEWFDPIKESWRNENKRRTLVADAFSWTAFGATVLPPSFMAGNAVTQMLHDEDMEQAHALYDARIEAKEWCSRYEAMHRDQFPIRNDRWAEIRHLKIKQLGLRWEKPDAESVGVGLLVGLGVAYVGLRALREYRALLGFYDNFGKGLADRLVPRGKIDGTRPQP